MATKTMRETRTNLGGKLLASTPLVQATTLFFTWLGECNARWEYERRARRVARWERDKAVREMLKLQRTHKKGAPVAREYFMEQVLNLRALERKAS
jgi:hypothetical protein